jgi:hypothetical protein
LQAVASAQEVVRDQVKEIHAIAATLEEGQGTTPERQERFAQLQKRLQSSEDPVRQRMAVVMAGFMVGLFAGADLAGLPVDNLELERWFRRPKGHERRIHGHHHAGIRIVQEGATLALVLDAHQQHEEEFSVAELLKYRDAQAPPDEQEALKRKARSKKKRVRLLADLEKRYLNAS